MSCNQTFWMFRVDIGFHIGTQLWSVESLHRIHILFGMPEVLTAAVTQSDGLFSIREKAPGFSLET